MPADVDDAGFPYSERKQLLCRTCLRPLTWETRTEPGFNPRTGWYDDARVDALVCFKSANYQHKPLTYRENAYYEAGFTAGRAPTPRPVAAEQTTPGTSDVEKVLHERPSLPPTVGRAGVGWRLLVSTGPLHREVLAEHFVMWHETPEADFSGEWRCACGKKFGFSDSAIDHQATFLRAALSGPADEHPADGTRA